MMFSREDIQKAEKHFRTNLINSITGFKSVALVGSKSSQGISNVVPISQIIHVGAHPPLIGLLFRPHVVARHTLENILDQSFFTINHIQEHFLVKAHHTSARWDNSEFEACGLEEEFLDNFPIPFVKQSVIKIGCRLRERLDVQTNGTHFLVGEIEHIYMPKDILGNDGFVDLEKAGTIACSGLDSYHKTQKVARLSYAKTDHVPYEL